MMKALVYTGVEEMEFREEKEPSEKPGESILKVHASGICGSDMHAYHGKDERRLRRLSLGHEVDVLSGPPYPEIHKNVNLIKIPGLNLFELEDNLLLFFTGFSRDSGSILKDQQLRSEKNESKTWYY